MNWVTGVSTTPLLAGTFLGAWVDSPYLPAVFSEFLQLLVFCTFFLALCRILRILLLGCIHCLLECLKLFSILLCRLSGLFLDIQLVAMLNAAKFPSCIGQFHFSSFVSGHMLFISDTKSSF